MGTQLPISLCMIVKDEADTLPACLSSAAGLADEIVVVDTGSTDSTKAAASRFGARVVDFAWCDDFAAARNESLRQATGEWIFWLDADERIEVENQQRLRHLFAGLKNENVAYTMRSLSRPQTSTGMAVLVGQVRLFRNDPRLRWEHRVHEQILPALQRCGTEVRPTEITIEHIGYQDANRLRCKLERDLHLLRWENADCPDNPFTLFNLGFVYLDLEHPEEAVPLLQRSLELSQSTSPFVPKLFSVLARAQSRLGQKAEALATLRMGRTRFPDDPELLFLDGIRLAEEGIYAEAEACLARLVRSQEEAVFANLHPGLRGCLGRHYLAGVYCAQGRLAEAEAEWRKALADWSSFAPAWRGLGELYARQGRWDAFAKVVERLKADPQTRLDGAVLRAERHVARAEFSAARKVLQDVIDAVPQALWPREILSRTLMKEGKDWAAAEMALRDVLALEPDHLEARHNLNVLLEQRESKGRKAARKCPPGPKGHLLKGNLPEYSRDPLGFLTYCARAYGDIVSLRFGRERVVLLNSPEYIEYVLVTGNRNFTKAFKRHYHPILGQGLFMSEGDSWRRQRRLVQPAFLRQRLTVHGKTIGALTGQMLSTWRDGDTRDLHQDMMRLMLEIAARTMLGIEDWDEVHDIGEALDTANQCIDARRNWLTDRLPTSNRLRLRRAIRYLDTILYRLIEQRRASSEHGEDLLSSLLHARLEQDGSRLTDRQLRDEAMNLLQAGRETTALALSWTWYLLAQNPVAVAELEAELDAVLSGRLPDLVDLPRLCYTERVVMESMRLYPPAFGLKRKVIEDCLIGGYRVPAGTTIILAPWVLHRDPRYFHDADRFQPNRWAGGLAERLPKFAYFPFGGGPRLCVGRTFGMMITVLVLATIAQKFRVGLAPDHNVMLWPTVTLRPWHGIKVVLKARCQPSIRSSRPTPACEGRAYTAAI